MTTNVSGLDIIVQDEKRPTIKFVFRPNNLRFPSNATSPKINYLKSTAQQNNCYKPFL